MNVIEKANVIYYHRQRMNHESEHTAKLGWQNQESQQKRFEVLCGIAPLSDQIILDVGCGLGDLRPFLENKFQNIVYLGIDHLPEFIDKAKQTYGGLKNTSFQRADFISDGLPEVDYVLASGALSYRTQNLIYLEHMIHKFYSIARKGVAFNLLDDEKFELNNVLMSYNRYQVLGYCLRIAERAELITDYLEEDFTIMMYK